LGLAWFLAYQFCQRYYVSHDIAPNVIDHDGLGYYGIRLDPLPCKVNGSEVTKLAANEAFASIKKI
jgi:hypothetical protein